MYLEIRRRRSSSLLPHAQTYTGFKISTGSGTDVLTVGAQALACSGRRLDTAAAACMPAHAIAMHCDASLRRDEFECEPCMRMSRALSRLCFEILRFTASNPFGTDQGIRETCL